ncbi:uncharacterized protein NPIL_123111 [Nephila pilipes]|uniref:Uncharacterized protein n=1 Tax=Nephila pilipes TaxID=299642 RepID=A0A8X6U3B6_NEPPI|nr:uncharacterized protein NPIL_123111 [Nephila pilipes]
MNNLYFPSEIKVAAIVRKSFFNVSKVNGHTVPNGLEGRMLKCLVEKLKFEFELVLPNNGKYGSRDNNGTWNGVVGLVQRGEADLGLAGLSITEDKWETVDFSIPYSAVCMDLIHSDDTGSNCSLSKNAAQKGHTFGQFPTGAGSVVSQAIDNVRETPWRRVLFGLWMTIAALMPFFYSISFLTYLTMPEKMPVPNNFEELSEAVLSGTYKCLPNKRAIEQELLLKSRIDYLAKMGEMIQKNGWEYSFGEKFSEILDNPVAIITSKKDLQILFGSPPYITMKISDDYFGIWNMAIAMKKGFCCRKRLNDVLYRIVSGGLFEKWTDDVSFADTLHKRLKKKHEEPKLQLTLEDLKLSFPTLFFGYALALLAFLAELMSPKSFDIFHS